MGKCLVLQTQNIRKQSGPATPDRAVTHTPGPEQVRVYTCTVTTQPPAGPRMVQTPSGGGFPELAGPCKPLQACVILSQGRMECLPSQWTACCKPRLPILISPNWDSPGHENIRKIPLTASGCWGAAKGCQGPGNLLCPRNPPCPCPLGGAGARGPIHLPPCSPHPHPDSSPSSPPCCLPGSPTPTPPILQLIP